jgi:hypothetical protein
MTEAEWLACNDPDEMLVLVRDPGRYRRLLLFAVACLERERETTGVHDSQRVRIMNLAERRADGDFTDPESHITAAVIGNMRQVPSERVYLSLLESPHQLNIAPLVRQVAEDSADWRFPRRVVTFASERAAQSDLLREIVGNPFRPAVCDPSWRTTDVLLLAQGIYNDGWFDRMPILADALQDAGCDSADILDHCRGPGPHVRGCWVVDLVLGKQ